MKTIAERMIGMQIDEFFWNYFEKTGVINAYLMYKDDYEENEENILAVSDEKL